MSSRLLESGSANRLDPYCRSQISILQLPAAWHPARRSTDAAGADMAIDVAQALLPVPGLMHPMHSAQARAPVPPCPDVGDPWPAQKPSPYPGRSPSVDGSIGAYIETNVCAARERAFFFVSVLLKCWISAAARRNIIHNSNALDSGGILRCPTHAKDSLS